MENMISFKQVEVEGTTKEEALAKAPFSAPVDTWHNATPKYKNFQNKKGAITPADLKQFMLDFIKAKKMAPGQGAYIVLDAAVKDTRKRPYEYEDVKHEGSRRYAKVFQIIDENTGEILATTNATEVPQKDKEGNVLKDEEGNVRMKISSETKATAKKVAAALYTEKNFTGNLSCKTIKIDINGGDDVVFRMKYAPSKNTKNGRYIVFGLISD